MEQHRSTHRLATLLVTTCLCFLPLTYLGAKSPASDLVRKISPVLKGEVDFLAENPHFDYPIPVIVQVQRDFFTRQEDNRRRRGAQSVNTLATVHGYTARLTAAQIRQVLRSPFVSYVTLDALVRPTNWDDNYGTAPLAVQLKTIGADLVGHGGKVRVAVFDSGIAANKDLPNGRVKWAVDFTSGGTPYEEKRVNDGYGHGTHVAGIIASEGKVEKYQKGVGPKIEILDMKVINDQGWGYTSTLIYAIEWLLQNQKKYKIEVANLSLGHPPTESYQNDPLCAAVRKLVAADIVTVVSGGNLGKTSSYPKIWGAITSPGIEPSVITVSPINTQGTLTHVDDTATSYGSRGPTLDGQFKPDLCAPGNAIASVLAEASWLEQSARSGGRRRLHRAQWVQHGHRVRDRDRRQYAPRQQQADASHGEADSDADGGQTGTALDAGAR